MEPVAHQIPWKAYHEAPGINASQLNAFARSPAYCLLRRSEPEKSTAALRIGVAVHGILLNHTDPKHVPEITVAEVAKAVAMAESLGDNPDFKKLLAHTDATEMSIFWERQGIRCKARPDGYGRGFILDVKTTRDLKRFSPWSITDYGYHIQAGWYQIALEEALDRETDAFYFPVVQSTEPFETAVFRLHNDSLRAGRADAEALFAALVHAETTGQWPRHFPGVKWAYVSWSELPHGGE